MMDEQVARANRGELRAIVEEREWRPADGDPVVDLQVGPVELGQLRDVGEIEGAVDRIHDLVGDAETLLDPLLHRRRHRPRHLDARDLAEAPAAQLELDRLEQVVGLVGDLEVGVAGDAEDRALEHVHPREERRQEVRQHLLERHEAIALADREKARQAFGNLDACKALLAVFRIAHEDRQADREAGDVRERLTGPNSERCQHRIDVARVSPLELLPLVVRELVDARDDDALGGKRRTELARPHARLLRQQLEDTLARLAQRLLRRPPVG